MNEIKISHSAVEITYMDYTNKWSFTVNGRYYEADSLNRAKEKIEEVIKAVKLKQRKQFEPISCFSYGLKHGRITSLVARKRTYRSEGEVWHVRFKEDGENGPGTVVCITELIADTPYNNEIIEDIRKTKEALSTLEDELKHLTEDAIPEEARQIGEEVTS